MTFKLCKTAPVLCMLAVLLLVCIAASAAGVLLGDADSDGRVTILDATAIQRSLAALPVNGEFSEEAADVDGDSGITILDATYIQRWLAGLDTPYPIGSQSDAPTEDPSGQPTNPPSQRPTDEEGWGRDVFKP